MSVGETSQKATAPDEGAREPHISSLFFETSSTKMKFAVGALLVATATAFSATSIQNARSIASVAPSVAFAPSVRLLQT